MTMWTVQWGTLTGHGQISYTLKYFIISIQVLGLGVETSL